MDVGTMDTQEVKRTVRRLFGGPLPWDRKGTMCLVHLDRPGPARRKARVDRFQPWDLLDPVCPHCRPVLEAGCFVLFRGDDETLGVRPLPDGKVEIVHLLQRPVVN